jgi:hypothetical protein
MPPRVTEGEHFFHTTTLGRRRGWRDTLSHIEHGWVPETVTALINWPGALRTPPGRVVILPGMSLAPDESTYEERRVRPFFFFVILSAWRRVGSSRKSLGV